MARTKGNYWQQRKDVQERRAKRSEDGMMKDLLSEYAGASKKIENEIAGFYAKYGKNNIIEYNELLRTLPKSEIDLIYRNFDKFADKYPQYKKLSSVRRKSYQLTRMEGLQIDIMQNLVELGAYEEEKMKEFLIKQFDDGYFQTLKDIETVFNFPGTHNAYNQRTLDYLLRNKWIDGGNYSDRIWGNKEKLANYLANEFKTGVAQGKSINQLSKQIQDRFGKSSYTADRLVRTESNYILNAAEQEAYNEDGIEEYEYLAALDERTSDICEALHGKRFNVAEYEPGVNAPPMHPFCRSTTVPVIK